MISVYISVMGEGDYGAKKLGSSKFRAERAENVERESQEGWRGNHSPLSLYTVEKRDGVETSQRVKYKCGWMEEVMNERVSGGELGREK